MSMRSLMKYLKENLLEGGEPFEGMGADVEAARAAAEAAYAQQADLEEVEPRDPGRELLAFGMFLLICSAILVIAWWVMAYSPIAFAKQYKALVGVEEVTSGIAVAFASFTIIMGGSGIALVVAGAWVKRNARRTPPQQTR